MVCPKFKYSTHQVMPPHLESMYYGCKLYIMSGIVLLMLLQLSWLATYHVVVLHKDSSKPLSVCIGTHHKIFLWICNLQYRCTGEDILQLLEAFFTLQSPFELYPLLLQRIDGMCNLGKSPLISCKSHKRSYICHISWSRPIHNGFNPFSVY